VAVLTLFANAALASTITYYFTMNTSSLSGTAGIIDMQFSEQEYGSGGGTTAYNTDATATVSDFQTDGTLVAEDPYTTPYPGSLGFLASGDVTGTLTGPVVFTADGDGAVNDYAQQLTFGNQLSFQLILSGQGVTTPICPNTGDVVCSSPAFVLDFLDSTGSSFLFSNDPSGSTPTGWIVGGVNVNLNTSTTPFTNLGPGNGPSDLTVSSVPEPGTLPMLATGLAALFAFARRRWLRSAWQGIMGAGDSHGAALSSYDHKTRLHGMPAGLFQTDPFRRGIHHQF
jgi:hypothetical protein